MAPNPSLGAEVCSWIETYLCHGPGDIQEEPIDLDDEFRVFIWRAYEVYPKDHQWAGRRVYPRAFLSRPKGRAKSELAGMLCCVEALGEVRFDGWNGDTPIGAPVTSPIIRTLATEEGQAGNTYDNCVFMLQNGGAMEAFPGLDVGLTRINLPNGGSIEPVTSASKSKDGGKETFVVADEVHLWTTPELHRLYATVTRNITKRKLASGWLMVTSNTMYAPGEGSVAESIHDAAKGRKMPGLLWDHREAPADTDIEDDDKLRQALEYVYGSAASWTNIDGIIHNAKWAPQQGISADSSRLGKPQRCSGTMSIFPKAAATAAFAMGVSVVVVVGPRHTAVAQAGALPFATTGSSNGGKGRQSTGGTGLEAGRSCSPPLLLPQLPPLPIPVGCSRGLVEEGARWALGAEFPGVGLVSPTQRSCRARTTSTERHRRGEHMWSLLHPSALAWHHGLLHV